MKNKEKIQKLIDVIVQQEALYSTASRQELYENRELTIEGRCCHGGSEWCKKHCHYSYIHAECIRKWILEEDI